MKTQALSARGRRGDDDVLAAHRGLEGARPEELELLPRIRDHHRATAEDVARTYEHWVANGANDCFRLSEGECHVARGLAKAEGGTD